MDLVFGISSKGDCEMTMSVIFNGKDGVWTLGTATLTDCTVHSNGGNGVSVYVRGQVTVTRCSLSHNKEWGVIAKDCGQCDVSDSHMTGNGKGAIGEAIGGKVISSNNTGG